MSSRPLDVQCRDPLVGGHLLRWSMSVGLLLPHEASTLCQRVVLERPEGGTCPVV